MCVKPLACVPGQYLTPQIGVVGRRIAAGKGMRKIRRVIAGRHRSIVGAFAFESGRLEGHDLGRRRHLIRPQPVPGLIDERRREILKGCIALAKLARAEHLFEQCRRHRLVGSVVVRVMGKHLRLVGPHLVVLRRKLDEVARYVGPRQRRIGDRGQHAVQRMAELVEQRPDLAEGQEHRLAGCGLRDVDVVDDHRSRGEQLRLADVVAHPGAALLVVARKIVREEQRQRFTVGVVNLEHANVIAIGLEVLAFLERQAVQLVRRIEDAVLQHAVELEVRFDVGIVKVKLSLAHPLCVVGPVPRLERERPRAVRRGLGVDRLLDVGRLAPRLRECRRQELGEHLVGRLRRSRGLVGEHIRGVRRIAKQRRALSAQPHDARDDGCVIRLAAETAGDGRAVDALPNRAVLEPLEHRLDGRVLQGNQPAVRLAALFGSSARRALLLDRQPVKIGFGVDQHRPVLGCLQHVLPELGSQRRQFLIERSQLDLVGLAKIGTGANEVSVITAEQLQRLHVEAEAGPSPVQRLDASEQQRVKPNGIIVCSESWRQLLLELLHRRVGVRAVEVAEHALHSLEQLARALQCDDRVVEGRGGSVVRDGVDFLPFLRHARLVGRPVIGVVHSPERRQIER